MPFTPFHFGPGLLLKAAMPRHFSFCSFAVTQVVIDCETLYHLVRRDWPVHRILHTYVGGTVAGLVVGALVFALARLWRGLTRNVEAAPSEQQLRQETNEGLAGALLGGIVGGASHALLDSIMHADTQPFWPFAMGNGLQGMISVGSLHLGCVVAGLLGIGILLVNRPPKLSE